MLNIVYLSASRGHLDALRASCDITAVWLYSEILNYVDDFNEQDFSQSERDHLTLRVAMQLYD